MRPRLLLVPEFTEVQWAIRPLLEQWAEVASYDSPGVGDEPEAPDPFAEATLRRGLREVEQRGWDRFFVVADGWGIPTGVRLAAQRASASTCPHS
jgi:hypothetical protein